MSGPTHSLIHCLVLLCLVASGLAWASHVDISVPAGEPAASEAHAHFDGLDLVEICDHCCHAGAHLVALPSAVPGSPFEVIRAYVPAGNPALTQPQTDPPFIPPIV